VLATLSDVNRYLPTEKIEVTEPELELFEVDASRIIRGYLAGVFSPATLAAWADPVTTPELIRSIAGRLIAALFYRERYSEDSLEDPQYAQKLYDDAMAWIMDIREGDIQLIDVTEVPTTGDRFTIDDFWPNDDSPLFTIDQKL
jgi:hypothetical protein